MGKSIFDIVSENVDMESEANRIITMVEQEDLLCCNKYSFYKLFRFVDIYCFSNWEHRGHFININDFLKAVDYTNLKKQAPHDVNALLTLIELVYNFWNLSNQQFYNNEKDYELQWCTNYYHLRDVMNDILEQYNHVAYTNDDENYILVVEDKKEVTAVAEILPTNLSFDVIKYNHSSLQGDIDTKKRILLSLCAELEPRRKELQNINKKLSEDIFFMLNNLNIRHNNRSKKDLAKYKAYVAKMTKSQFEKWYDELYQMILLAFLLLDNEARKEKVQNLKSKITGE